MSTKDLLVEIVERICDCLDRYSVFQLALVSRSFYNGAASQIFHTLSVRFTSQDTFRENCEYANSVLASPQKSQQVRHLRVFGFMKGDTSIKSDWDAGPSTRNRGPKIPSGVFADITNCERLVRIMVQLTTLQDFTWESMEQIPSRVLYLLHESFPLIRLHMPIFCLKSLILSLNDPIRIDLYELELATSPCLYSLGYRDTNGPGR